MLCLTSISFNNSTFFKNSKDLVKFGYKSAFPYSKICARLKKEYEKP
jgi:hypothetical protein